VRGGTGSSREEVRKMAMPPTCVKCGSILMGYGWDKELNYLVYFCTECKEGAPKEAVLKKEAA
jgi:hypothetical protein